MGQNSVFRQRLGPWLVYVGVAAACATFLAVMDTQSKPAIGLGFTGFFLLVFLAVVAGAEGTEALFRILDRPRSTPHDANGS